MQEVLPKWDLYAPKRDSNTAAKGGRRVSVHKGLKLSLAEMFMHGVPSQLRGVVWAELAGNKLSVTRNLYEQLRLLNSSVLRLAQVPGGWVPKVDREGKLLPDVDYVVSVLA